MKDDRSNIDNLFIGLVIVIGAIILFIIPFSAADIIIPVPCRSLATAVINAFF